MQNASEARGWDIEKARLIGVVDRLHVTIDGLLAANRELSRANQELLKANMVALQDLADIFRMSRPNEPQAALADIHRMSSPKESHTHETTGEKAA